MIKMNTTLNIHSCGYLIVNIHSEYKAIWSLIFIVNEKLYGHEYAEWSKI